MVRWKWSHSSLALFSGGLNCFLPLSKCGCKNSYWISAASCSVPAYSVAFGSSLSVSLCFVTSKQPCYLISVWFHVVSHITYLQHKQAQQDLDSPQYWTNLLSHPHEKWFRTKEVQVKHWRQTCQKDFLLHYIILIESEGWKGLQMSSSLTPCPNAGMLFPNHLWPMLFQSPPENLQWKRFHNYLGHSLFHCLTALTIRKFSLTFSLHLLCCNLKPLLCIQSFASLCFISAFKYWKLF